MKHPLHNILVLVCTLVLQVHWNTHCSGMQTMLSIIHKYESMYIWYIHPLGTSSCTSCTRSRKIFWKLSSSHVAFTISLPAVETSSGRASSCRQEGLSDYELLAKVAYCYRLLCSQYLKFLSTAHFCKIPETTSTVNTQWKVIKTFRECEAHHSLTALRTGRVLGEAWGPLEHQPYSMQGVAATKPSPTPPPNEGGMRWSLTRVRVRPVLPNHQLHFKLQNKCIARTKLEY